MQRTMSLLYSRWLILNPGADCLLYDFGQYIIRDKEVDTSEYC